MTGADLDPARKLEAIRRSAANAAQIARAKRDAPNATVEDRLETVGLLLGFVDGVARP
jgi:hypothetical protein